MSINQKKWAADVPQKNCIRLYFSFRPSRLNVSPSETKIEPDRRLPPGARHAPTDIRGNSRPIKEKRVTHRHVQMALRLNVSSFLSSESLIKMSISAFPGNCCGVKRSPILCDSPAPTCKYKTTTLRGTNCRTHGYMKLFPFRISFFFLYLLFVLFLIKIKEQLSQEPQTALDCRYLRFKGFSSCRFPPKQSFCLLAGTTCLYEYNFAPFRLEKGGKFKSKQFFNEISQSLF